MLFASGKWIVCQLGAREHYSIPCALEKSGLLDRFITDFWVPPGPFVNGFSAMARVRGRWHDCVPIDRVIANNRRMLAFEIGARIRRRKGWEVIFDRNKLFQKMAVAELDAHGFNSGTGTVFSFSYTARKPFRWAKRRGLRTVLGQIDPGAGMEKLVEKLHDRHGQVIPRHRCPPREYWEEWREECALAEKIVVNSQWSKDLLINEGIDETKVRIVPLVYTPPREAIRFERIYPDRFDERRPLRVLFLGQINVGKGAMELLDAADKLKARPVEFWMVGPLGFEVPEEYRQQRHVRWVGSVPRSQVNDFFRRADVFLFPTHSDGFGMTQLEAQAWRLPLISSRNCGRVVCDSVNGLELPDVTAETIVEGLEVCLADPQRLAAWANQAVNLDDYSIERLAERLVNLP